MPVLRLKSPLFSGTPNIGGNRRFVPTSPSPLTSKPSTQKSQEPLDEWEQKLLGKKSTSESKFLFNLINF